MHKAKSNWNRLRISPSFPYLRILEHGKPEHREEAPKHPPMDQGHRAKIFAPFDALDGFSEMIRQKDRLPEEEAAHERPEGNIRISGEDP